MLISGETVAAQEEIFSIFEFKKLRKISDDF